MSDVIEAAKQLFLEGLSLLSNENYVGAEKKFRRALEYVPERVSVLTNLSAALFRQGKIAEAKDVARRSINNDKSNEQGWLNLGLCLAKEYDLKGALSCYDEALKINPNYVEAWTNRGALLGDLKQYHEAFLSFDHALSINPNFVDAWLNKGNLKAYMKNHDEAQSDYLRALEIQPDYAEAHAFLADSLGEQKRYDEAVAHFKRSREIKSSVPYVLGQLINAKMQCCNWQDFDHDRDQLIDAVENYERATYPFNFLSITSSPHRQLRCAEIYSQDRYPASPQPLWCGQRYQHERIRLGYFSSDFRNHPMGHLIAEMIERLDRSKFEVMAFSFSPPTSDPIRLRLEKAFDRFIDVSSKSNHEIASLANQLEIDIAVDLNGYTANSRTSIFAMRPAPIQVNHMGYPGTMGVDYIDYIVADGTVIPPEHYPFCSEKVVTLPDTYWFNDSTKVISDRNFSRAELGLPDDAFVFCCFNNNYKITPDAFAIWMNLLKRIPGSVLWLSAGNETAVTNLRKECSGRGVDPSRLVFAKRMELLSEHFARHRLADLFLDTFYYNAHTTASDALWAGLPILTCIGETFASRVAASLLTAIGMRELITHSHEEYETLAFELATQPDKLAALKEKLARNRLTTPLFDTARFTRHIETAYTMMWQRYQAGLEPEHISVSQ